MDKISIVVYTVKNTGMTADDVRNFIRKTYGIESYVSLHPNRLVIRLSTPVSSSDIKGLHDFISESLDGKIIEKY